jgi:DNA-binding transcriptional MerR regulator
MSIGEVLAHLRTDFPDTTISKLRFLEAEGLVEPRRTPAGYRKYSWADVARLRYVLTAQRDHYLPLRVIRDQLAALDEGVSSDAAGGARRPSLFAVEGAERAAPDPVERGELRLSRAELLAHSGLAEADLQTLEQYGLVAARNGGGYDADALEIAGAAANLAEYGVQARHLRAYRAAADREIGLFTQLAAPLARQGGPAARARAAETVRELAAQTERLHAALVRAGLREILGR